MVNKAFEFLEHSADVYIAAYGRSLEEAFANAAKAMFEVMTDTSKVRPLVKKVIHVEGFDLPSLLYSWLEELLYIFDVEGLVFSKFNILSIYSPASGKYVLDAEVYGEPLDPSRHPLGIGIKAVTYSLMEVVDVPGNCQVKFVLDI